MAWANVAMAGLELGLETKAIQSLASSGGRLAVQGVRLSRQQWTKLLQAARCSPAELDLYLATQRGLSPEAKALLRESVLPNARTQAPPRAPEVPNEGARPGQRAPKPEGQAPKPKPEGAKPKPKPDERVPVPQRTPDLQNTPKPKPTSAPEIPWRPSMSETDAKLYTRDSYYRDRVFYHGTNPNGANSIANGGVDPSKLDELSTYAPGF
jgi:hypothetical protein